MDGSDLMTDSLEPLAIAAEHEHSPEAPAHRPSFGTLLMDAGLVTREQLYQALAEGTRTGERLGEVLIRHGLTSEHDVARMLSDQFQLPLLDADSVAVDPAGWDVLPSSEARRLEACVVGFEGEVPVAALADPNPALFNSLRQSLGEETRFAIVTASTLKHLLDSAPTDDLVEELAAAAAAADVADTAAPTGALVLEFAGEPVADGAGALVEADGADAEADDAVAPTYATVADSAPASVDLAEASDDSQADEPRVDPDTALAEFDGVTAKLQDSVETLKSLRLRLAHLVETSVGTYRELDLCHRDLDAERAARAQDHEKMRQLEEQLTERTQLLAEMKAKLGDFVSGLGPLV